MPTKDLHGPVREMSEFMMKVVEGREKLPVITRKPFTQLAS